ncbi:uncharacterized protein BDR25DRAFT_357113 [Lindgomyces ingoldianus]|uniref:Uncharacterized protein n=1 Tax=Lindgomyces ingoldianus TaxID=673940 RepID=A0ACB6QQ98_9PLEO|nr:uncharacterized protein BDR25DRAFT_357113 [Lindgomyces ingoldianus]KAF2468743.1 hypothetical protein BDR25DRAFT_357113 [Lindgomyces ingoldianus]
MRYAMPSTARCTLSSFKPRSVPRVLLLSNKPLLPNRTRPRKLMRHLPDVSPSHHVKYVCILDTINPQNNSTPPASAMNGILMEADGFSSAENAAEDADVVVVDDVVPELVRISLENPSHFEEYENLAKSWLILIGRMFWQGIAIVVAGVRSSFFQLTISQIQAANIGMATIVNPTNPRFPRPQYGRSGIHCRPHPAGRTSPKIIEMRHGSSANSNSYSMLNYSPLTEPL